MKKRAIISVSDKEGIVEFAGKLIESNYTVYSTGGTLELLKAHHGTVKSIKALTKFPEILDGRVKTLHPQIHGGILADKSNPKHVELCHEYGIQLMDLVVVNLYPFEKTVAKEDCAFSDAIENIDIGGPTLIRAAAKNYQSVGVVTSPDDYNAIAKEIVENKGKLLIETKQKMAIKAFKLIASYDIAISNYFEKKQQHGSTDELPHFISNSLEKVSDLRYGENPHQKAAVYKHKNVKSDGLQQLHGKELSFNNLLDIDAAIHIVKEFKLPGAVVIKHTNPCGAAIDETLSAAYSRAYEADPLSAFGSIVGLNRSVDLKTADDLQKTFIEVIVAPSFDDDAFKLLSKKSNIRLIKVDFNVFSHLKLSLKDLGGTVLIQTPDTKVINQETFECVTDRQPSVKEVNDLEFAFSLVKYIKSNAILLVKDGQTIGVGAGQMSRVDSVEIALKKAGDKAKGAVMASDAFFPFKDSVELSAKFGVSSIIQPGGSRRDQESIDACNEKKMSMIFTGSRHFKH